MPAATLTAWMSGSTLRVEGTESSDTIYVRTSSAGVSVDGVRINVNGSLRTSVPLSSITKVEVNALGGNDTVSTNVQNGMSIPCTIWGGNGNDTLYGSNGNDILVGGPGQDTLYGNNGDDTLHGGSSSYGGGSVGELDKLVGGPGFDTYTDAFDQSKPVYNGVSIFDVNQELSPTCQTLAALAGAVRVNNNLAGNISYRGGSSYQIKLFANGRSFQQPVTFSGVWNDNDPAPAVDSSGRSLPEFWTILYQRARMNYLGVNTSQSMTTSQWDAANRRTGNLLYSSVHAAQLFTGRSVNNYSPVNMTSSVVGNAFNQGRMVVASTFGSGQKTIDPKTGIVQSHVYAVTGIFSNGDIQLYNPWGQDSSGPARDGVQDGLIRLTRAEFNRYFNGVSVI